MSKSPPLGTAYAGSVHIIKKKQDLVSFNKLLAKIMSKDVFGSISGLGSLATNFNNLIPINLNALKLPSIDLLNNLNLDPNFLGSLSLNLPNLDISNLINKLKSGDLVSGLSDALNILTGVDITSGTILEDLLINELGVSPEFIENDTFGIFTAKKAFTSSLVKTLTGLITSRIYLPELIFLYELKFLHFQGADPNTKNKYLREVCLKKDHSEVIKWLDKEIDKRTIYNIGSYPDNDFDGILASKNGSHKTCVYFMDILQKMIVELDTKIAIVSANNANIISSIKRLEEDNTKLESEKVEKEIKKEDTKSLTDIIKANKDLITIKKKGKEDNEQKESIYKVNKMNMQNMIYNLTKNLIVYSYGDFTLSELDKIMKKYKSSPSFFGDNDKTHNQRFHITEKEIDIMAPIYQRQVEESEEIVRDLKIVKVVEPNTKFIIPRNINIKKLYIYLVSNIHGNKLIHQKLYERLKLPIYDEKEQLLDDVFKTEVQMPANKTPSLDTVIYDYTKTVEHILRDQSQIEYLYSETEIPELSSTITVSEEYKNKDKAKSEDKTKEITDKIKFENKSSKSSDMFGVFPSINLPEYKSIYINGNINDINIDDPRAFDLIFNELSIFQILNKLLSEGKSISDILANLATYLKDFKFSEEKYFSFLIK